MSGGFYANHSPGALRILVVDDNDAARYAKVRLLKQAGYTVLEADSGRAALQMAAEKLPSLVLLDIRLPDINGLEVCRRLKGDPQTAQILVLQMSATFRDDQAKIAGLECGADGYLAEPMEPSLLVATIAAFLRTQQAEQAVRDHALEWQATFNAIGDGVALVDTSGRVMRFNQAFAAFAFVHESNPHGQLFDTLLPPAEKEEISWGTLVPGLRERVERTSGDRVFSITIDPVSGRPDKLLGAVCIVSDVTERKNMDERLWHTQKLESIGLLAGGVAHDFNNLLTGILGNASLGLENVHDAGAAERALRDITRAAERAADLTRQLLAYAGKGRFLVERMDLSQAVTAMLPLLQTYFSRKIEVVLNMAQNLPAIEADRTQIEQIVMNLLINAAEAIGDNSGSITVTTKTIRLCPEDRNRYLADRELAGEYVMLEVRDTGKGMSPETVSHIFDPFFTTKFMGRGLGLSAVQGILRGHKGAIRVTSNPGRGATFELLFPSAGSPARARDEGFQSAAGTAPARGTILVVEDEKLVRDFFRAALVYHGYEVVEAPNGAAALDIFLRNPESFTAVLLDLVMPVMGGKETLPRLLEQRPGIPVVVTSGQVEDEARRELTGYPIAGFIQKPCAARALADTLKESIAAGSPSAV